MGKGASNRIFTIAALAGALTAPVARAAITVLNNSFESPTVTLAQVASPFVDNWTTDGPSKLDIGGGILINTNCGIFPNTPAGNNDSIDNVDGNQAAFIGAQTGNEFAQILSTNFLANNSYKLTVAIAHSFGSPPDSSAEIKLQLFYIGADTQRHIVASTDVFNDAATALSANHFKDFSALSATLAANDPAVGKPIGILLTTIGPVGGFFDLDNVRLVPEPASLSAIILLGGVFLTCRRRA